MKSIEHVERKCRFRAVKRARKPGESKELQATDWSTYTTAVHQFNMMNAESVNNSKVVDNCGGSGTGVAAVTKMDGKTQRA